MCTLLFEQKNVHAYLKTAFIENMEDILQDKIAVLLFGRVSNRIDNKVNFSKPRFDDSHCRKEKESKRPIERID
jgi:hypothetical protein